ncbi:hypothetical protein GE21DRAFT_7921 [Neurospora crassa]|uniref:Uncharacterized protein n=2 Tax=Neurospora crassa TaxID=5141 RepID=Q1K748_NEUCR|nr:hypothetical protein NCU06686 [Neurospora crassa OR74A]EAA31765.1 hypothetical protein NCU06686 [Neurospora crassa OR74A]KHE86969.1 hypothetical protein GE21DRAFT_7921 [Neurospora crassa]CAD70911.1 hypothetical protein [Neurospora crassa]|eukprot:XP_961001.1 hypothetical protein NCU06686 [Neurospora crassa OR74A]
MATLGGPSQLSSTCTVVGTKESARPNIDAPSPFNTPSMASSLRTTELPFRRMTVPHLNAPTLTGISVQFFFFALRRALETSMGISESMYLNMKLCRALSSHEPYPKVFKGDPDFSGLLYLGYDSTNTPMRPRSHGQAGPKTAIEKSQTRSEEIVPLARPEKNKTSTSWAVGSPLPGIGSRATFILVVSSIVP